MRGSDSVIASSSARSRTTQSPMTRCQSRFPSRATTSAPSWRRFRSRRTGRTARRFVIDVVSFFSATPPPFRTLACATETVPGSPARSCAQLPRRRSLSRKTSRCGTRKRTRLPSRGGPRQRYDFARHAPVDRPAPKAPMRAALCGCSRRILCGDASETTARLQKADSQASFVAGASSRGSGGYARGELVEPLSPIVYTSTPRLRRAGAHTCAGGSRTGRDPSEGVVQNGFSPGSSERDGDLTGIRRIFAIRSCGGQRSRAQRGRPEHLGSRTGEIIETTYVLSHHMRSYRNRLLIETGSANPVARTLDCLNSSWRDDAKGHPLRCHSMRSPPHKIASSSIPIDPAKRVLASRYGVSMRHGLRAPELHRATGRQSYANVVRATPRPLR